MNEVEALIAQLQLRGDEVWIAGPQTNEAVADLEQAIGVTMPASYREFLLRIGGLSIGDWFISGIIDKQPLRHEAGYLYGDTLTCREVWSLPSNLLVIQADQNAPYCLRAEASPTSEYPVVCFELHSRHESQIAPSFLDWLLETLRLRANPPPI